LTSLLKFLIMAIYLITGATGKHGNQGGSVANHLLSSAASLGHKVRVLVRDLSSEAAQALQSKGAELFQGDFSDLNSLKRATTGCKAIFISVGPDLQDRGAELRHAQNLIAAAKYAGVEHAILSSVLNPHAKKDLTGIEPDSFLISYWETKAAVENEVTKGGFQNWSIFRAGYFMTNYLQPSSAFMYPELKSEGVLLTTFKPETKLSVVDPGDVGKFVAASFLDPEKAHGQAIDLVAESLTIQEIAEQFSVGTGKSVVVKFHSEEEAEKIKAFNPLTQSQIFINNNGMRYNTEPAQAFGIQFTTLRKFVEQHKAEIIESIGSA
jgi:uncharacterized protein YbjT (DUF2867 family)